MTEVILNGYLEEMEKIAKEGKKDKLFAGTNALASLSLLGVQADIAQLSGGLTIEELEKFNTKRMDVYGTIVSLEN